MIRKTNLTCQLFLYTLWYSISALVWLIISKSVSNLLKQQLFDIFRQYLSIGKSLLIFFPPNVWQCRLELQTFKIYLYIVFPCSFDIYIIETRFMCANIFFNPIKINMELTLWSCRLTLELELSSFFSVMINFFLTNNYRLCI